MIDLDYMAGLVPVILRFVPLTFGMAVGSMIGALVLAAVLAVIRVLRIPVAHQAAGVFISFFRGTPLLVQLFLFYYGLPQAIPAFVAIDGVTAAMLGLTLHFAAYMAESLRGAILGVARDQWEAARAVGMKNGRIALVHVFPNTLAPLIVLATAQLGSTILTEASLSFLGLGVPPPLPSWGLMIAEGKDYMFFSPWVIFVPGVALFVLVFGINLLGDGLRDLLGAGDTR